MNGEKSSIGFFHTTHCGCGLGSRYSEIGVSSVYFLIQARPFLRISLSFSHPARSQTIYGELISLESNSDVLGLAMFILHRLLWNPDIAAEFRHTKVPHLYKDGNLRFSTGLKRSIHLEFLKESVACLLLVRPRGGAVTLHSEEAAAAGVFS